MLSHGMCVNEKNNWQVNVNHVHLPFFTRGVYVNLHLPS